MSELPNVSCFCPTYGRTKLLMESVNCFLNQDYKGKKELIILNDFDQQELFFNHPEVKVINSKKIKKLSDKFNECISHCSGDYIFVWEDDDIFLPWRISFSINNLDKNGCFHTRQAFKEIDHKKIVFSDNLHHSALCMHRDCWEKIGFYSESDGTTIDTLLFNKIKDEYGIIHQQINNENIYNIYRYETTNHYHGSMLGQNFSERALIYLQEKIKNKEEPTDRIIIKPYWKYDYVETVNLFLKNSK